MSWEARNKVKEEMNVYLDGIMELFPKDYSDTTIKIIRGNIKANIGKAMKDYNEAFCKDNDLCPTCITGGWDCDSDHQ